MHHQTQQPSPRPFVPVRIYVHEAIATLVTGAQISSPNMLRHDAVLMLALGGASFTVHPPEGPPVTLQAVAVAPHVRHAVDATGCRLVRLAAHIIHPRFPALRALLKEPVTTLSRAAFAHFDERLEDAYHGRLDMPATGVLMEDIIDEVLAHAAPTPPVDPRIVWVIRKLEEDINASFDEMAATLGMSQSRLSHLFTDQLGVSLRGCQAWGRMVKAWEMLTWKRPDMSMTEVAHTLGFSDSSHLSRAFKRRYGMTPSMFRDPSLVEILHTPPPPDGSRVPVILSAS